MINDKLSFLSNNLNENKASGKILFEYFRNLSTPAGFVFLPETLLGRCRKKMEQRFSRTIVFFTW